MILAVAMTADASADPMVEVHAGGGIPTDRSSSGEQWSAIVGGAVRLVNADRKWSPRLSLDVRRLDGGVLVGVGDFTSALYPRAIGVRSMVGVRLQGTTTGWRTFGQLSVGLEWERATWEEVVAGRPGPTVSNGLVHFSDTSFVVEPAFGASGQVGRFAVGAQLALAIQFDETIMPIEINEQAAAPVDLLLTLFVETPL